MTARWAGDCGGARGFWKEGGPVSEQAVTVRMPTLAASELSGEIEKSDVFGGQKAAPSSQV